MTVAATVFVLSAFAIFYILFGYPALLWALTRRRGHRPLPAGHPQRTISVILPVRNGERWIGPKLDSILAFDYPSHLLQIIVISDSSEDRTEEIVRRYGDRVLLLQNPGRGKADAINCALENATGEILFFTDVRQLFDPVALRALVTQFDDPDVGVATGELMIRSGNVEEDNVGLYWRYEKWLRQRHSQIDSVLGATGAIYAMRRLLARPLPPGTLLDDVLMPMQAFFSGYRIIFVPEAKAYDIPTAIGAEFKRKVRTLAGVYQLIGECPRLLGPSNRMWFHFMSHKVARLFLPYALAALLLSSFFLPWPWNTVLVALQIGFYGMAILDPMISGSPLKRMTSLARTFVVLMWAAVCATSIFILPSQNLWKTAGEKKAAGSA